MSLVRNQNTGRATLARLKLDELYLNEVLQHLRDALNEGARSKRDMVDHFNGRGFLTRRGKTWSERGMRRLFLRLQDRLSTESTCSEELIVT